VFSRFFIHERLPISFGGQRSRFLAFFLGQDVELRMDWHWNTFMLFRMGYDHFFKGTYIQTLAQVPGNPSAKDSDYFYAQTELRF